MIEALKKDNYDLLIILGDFAYNLEDNYGQKGDDYFDALEPLITKVPFLGIPGNNDMADIG